MDEVGGYEKVREATIKQNKEKMQRLGLLNLSSTLKTSSKPSLNYSAMQSQNVRRSPRKRVLQNVVPSSQPVRRSLR